MNWHPMTEPPKRTGTYYVRYVTSDYNGASFPFDKFYTIRTYPFTRGHGWNTTVLPDKSISHGNAICFDAEDEWSEVEYVDC